MFYICKQFIDRNIRSRNTSGTILPDSCLGSFFIYIPKHRRDISDQTEQTTYTVYFHFQMFPQICLCFLILICDSIQYASSSNSRQKQLHENINQLGRSSKRSNMEHEPDRDTSSRAYHHWAPANQTKKPPQL